MAVQVTRALNGGQIAVLEAGTGTGKSLAYLVPAILSGRKVVIATATKALQDQLATKSAMSRGRPISPMSRTLVPKEMEPPMIPLRSKLLVIM